MRDLLDVVGLALLVAAVALLTEPGWALGAAGASCLLVSWSLARRGHR